MTYQNTKSQFNRPSISRRVWEFIGAGAFMLFFAYLIMWVLINWVMGCGEVFYQADGSYIPGECAPFMPWEFFGGNW